MVGEMFRSAHIQDSPLRWGRNALDFYQEARQLAQQPSPHGVSKGKAQRPLLLEDPLAYISRGSFS